VCIPFQCVPNPNGTKSIASNPSLICWSTDEHIIMILLGSIGLLVYPVAVLAMVSYITWSYPSYIARGMGMRLVKRYNFLFSRFVPERYYYALIYLGRSSLISLVPVIFPGHAMYQVLTLSVILCGTLLSQARLWPWRTHTANYSDMGVSLGLICLMQGGTTLVDVDTSDTQTALAAYLVIVLATIFIEMFFAATLSVYRRFQSSNMYDAFLCHHKGVQPRWLDTSN